MTPLILIPSRQDIRADVKKGSAYWRGLLLRRQTVMDGDGDIVTFDVSIVGATAIGVLGRHAEVQALLTRLAEQ